MVSETTKTKAAPSEVCEELPAVTEPPAAKTGFSFAKAAKLVSALGPSSVSTMYSRVFFFMLASK